MRTIETMLTEHLFLKGLKPDYIQLIAGCAKNAAFAEDEYLFREGEAADQFFLIRDGKVAVEVYAAEHGPITIQTVDQGDILGWSWMIPPHRWRFDAKALETTRVFSFDGKCLREKCKEDTAFGYELLMRFTPIIAQRLEATRLQLLDMYSTKP